MQNLQNESSMTAQAVAAMQQQQLQQQHNSHLVPRGQSTHVGHPVSVGQNQGSRLQVRARFEMCENVKRVATPTKY